MTDPAAAHVKGYLDTVEKETQVMMDSYMSIIKNSSIVNEYTSAQSRLNAEVSMRSMVRAVEVLLGLVHELRLQIVLHDYKEINQEVAAQQEQYEKVHAKILQAQLTIRQELQQVIYDTGRAQYGDGTERIVRGPTSASAGLPEGPSGGSS